MRRALGIILAMAAACLAAYAAPPRPPSPEDAPHGIANQAADPSSRADVAKGDQGPVAVPEPSEKARRYARSGNVLWVIDMLWGLVVPAVILFSGFSARLRDLARKIGRNWFGTIVVYGALFLILTFVVGLPFSYLVGYVRPHAYGLSNQTFSKWLGDELKALLVSLVGGSLLLWMPYGLVRRSPRRWWLWTSLLAIPIAVFFILIAPIVIDPLFNKFGPMKDHELEGRILDLANRAGIEGARVFEVDKSVDTNTVNAYVTGFGGSKRIVLWDTTIRKLDPDELLFVMGHEMGHYVLGHIVKSILFSSILILVTLFLADRLQAGLIARYRDRFGFGELSDIASFPLVLLLGGLLTFAITPVANAYSRWQEHEADRFGLEITRDNHAAATAFVKLQQENLSLPRRSTLYKLWRASHPLLGERIDFCNEYRPWEEGRPGRYDKLFR